MQHAHFPHWKRCFPLTEFHLNYKFSSISFSHSNTVPICLWAPPTWCMLPARYWKNPAPMKMKFDFMIIHIIVKYNIGIMKAMLEKERERESKKIETNNRTSLERGAFKLCRIATLLFIHEEQPWIKFKKRLFDLLGTQSICVAWEAEYRKLMLRINHVSNHLSSLRGSGTSGVHMTLSIGSW